MLYDTRWPRPATNSVTDADRAAEALDQAAVLLNRAACFLHHNPLDPAAPNVGKGKYGYKLTEAWGLATEVRQHLLGCIAANAIAQAARETAK